MKVSGDTFDHCSVGVSNNNLHDIVKPSLS